MKICIFCRYFYPHIGGNETQAMNLALNLIKQKIKVIVVTARYDKILPKFEQYNGIDIYRVNIFSPYKIAQNILQHFKTQLYKTPTKIINNNDDSHTKISTIRYIFRWINNLSEEYSFMWNSTNLMRKNCNKFDLIHSQMLCNYGYMALRAGRKLHKAVLIKDATLGGLSLVKLQPFVSKKRELLKTQGHFVAISSMIADNFQKQGIKNNQIFKITNGIDISKIETKNNFKADTNSILFAGNFWQGEIKGLDILIKAIGIITQTNKSVKLRIAGQGNKYIYITLAKQCDCLNNIEFLGQIKNMDIEYRKNAIFVLPSRQEGMSNAILEAMSYGMPCIATDVSGVRDQINHRIEGLIVPVNNHIAMANAINFMLEHPREAREMGLNAKRKIINKFDMEVITKQTINVYQKLITDNGKHES